MFRRFRTLPLCGFLLIAACGDVFGPITELPRELTVAERGLIDADNRFAFKLFREINVQQSAAANVFISPLSVGMALGMAYNGAAGTTREAMRQTLELQGLSVADVNQAYLGVIDLLRTLDPRVEWLLANSVWHDQRFTPLAPFLDVTRTYFDAEVTALDFRAPATPGAINGWVDRTTNGKITTIVPDPIPDEVIAYLINAIYFKGDWTQQFDKDLTRDEPFLLASGSTVGVSMMSRKHEHTIRTFADPDLTVAELPYGGGAYVMTVVVPRDPTGAATLAPELTEERWNAWLGALDSQSVFVSLPKFELEYEIKLNAVLTALGMAEAFDPDRADLSNMFVVTPSQRFYLDEVLHKTFVRVDEEGTEAAAATSVGVGPTSAPQRILVDRPFLFAIRERLSGTILFLGKVMDPQAR